MHRDLVSNHPQLATQLPKKINQSQIGQYVRKENISAGACLRCIAEAGGGGGAW